jgi:acyl carrier protein
MSMDAQTLLTYLEEQLGLDRSEVDDDTLLFSEGLLDSFSVTALVQYIEDTSGIRMSPTEVNLDNLDSVARIVSYVEGKLA